MTANNVGEGSSELQGQYSPFADFIKNQWLSQTQGIINNIQTSNQSLQTMVNPIPNSGGSFTDSIRRMK